MTKEELFKKLEEISKHYSQEERLKLLEEIKNMLQDTNKELRSVHTKIKEDMG